jgi:NAD(P)-dependent dehydrogenase (short-subunit alcohol dehydrogenase family)
MLNGLKRRVRAKLRREESLMATPSFRLDDTPAMVTGAGSGIGARVAQGLAEFGASVGCVDVNSDGLSETVRTIEQAGGRAVAIKTDVTSPQELIDAVATVQAEFGPLKAALNCAGIHSNAPAEEMSLETWRSVIDTNLTGVFLSCQAEGAAMLANGGGAIVNIGSISATIANRGLMQIHYNSAKAGVMHLSRSLAVEWASRGVRVNVLSPGYTATPMAKNPEVWEHVKHYIDDIPMGRMAETDELVGPAVFLLSNASSYCTGMEVLVDGGACVW